MEVGMPEHHFGCLQNSNRCSQQVITGWRLKPTFKKLFRRIIMVTVTQCPWITGYRRLLSGSSCRPKNVPTLSHFTSPTLITKAMRMDLTLLKQRLLFSSLIQAFENLQTPSRKPDCR